MSVLRPKAPGPTENEPISPSLSPFDQSASMQLPDTSTFERQAPTMFVIATILLTFFLIFKRTRRPSIDTSPGRDMTPPHFYTDNDQPLKSAMAADSTRPGSSNSWDEYPSLQFPFQPPYYQYISHTDAQSFDSTISTSSSNSSASRSAALPAPTIRRHSSPSDNAKSEMTETTQDGTAELESIQVQENLIPNNRTMRLPPPWIPGRMDTVAMINGCRRHVMVVDGDPFRRGSAG